jgi:hypothetical protein
MKHLIHHGEYGDVIHGLAAAKAMAAEHGPVALHLRPAGPPLTREVMTPARAAPLIPLLRLQPYVADVRTDAPSAGADAIRLDAFRGRANENFSLTRNLADQHLEALGLSLSWRDEPWLWVDHAVRVAPVVLARSARVRNPLFPWATVVRRYAGRSVFVGTEAEYEDFVGQFGGVPYWPTADLLELARVIAGAELVAGNSSLPYAIAEAMKKPVVQEVCTYSPTTVFLRPHAVLGVDGSVAERLPEPPAGEAGGVDMEASFRPEWRSTAVAAEDRAQTVRRIGVPSESQYYAADANVLDALSRASSGLRQDASVLDFGAGMLRHSVACLERRPAWRVTAYDSDAMLHKGFEFWGERLSRHGARFAAEPRWSDLSRRRFDMVFASMCFQHVPPAHLRAYLRDLQAMTDRLLVYGRRVYDDHRSVVWDVVREGGWVAVDYLMGDPAELASAPPETHGAVLFRPAPRPSGSVGGV